MLHDDKLQMPHLVSLLIGLYHPVHRYHHTLAVAAVAAVAAGLGPLSPSADGKVDPLVGSNLDTHPPMTDLPADVDAVHGCYDISCSVVSIFPLVNAHHSCLFLTPTVFPYTTTDF